MTIKRMLPLLSAMAAFAAFAAPAAQAEIWWTSNGNTEEGLTLPGEEEAMAISSGGGKISSVSGTGLVSGPCSASGSLSLWNGSEMGEGQVNTFNLETPEPCPTNVPSCSVITETTSASHENPWPVTLTTTDTIDIYNVTFTTHFAGAGCGPAGVPTFVSVTGTITGTLENSSTPSSQMVVKVNLNNHKDDMFVEVNGNHVPVGIDLTGSFTLEPPGGLDLTFEHVE